MSWRTLGLSALLLMLGACSRLGWQSVALGADSSLEPTVDLVAENDVAEAGTPVDVGLTDGPMDLRHGEGSPDIQPVDLPVDVPLTVFPDIGTDAEIEAGLSSACSDKNTVFLYGDTMAICGSTSNRSTQCAAGAKCGAGWHLCSASEFLDRGGRTKVAPVGAWLASCVRTAGSVHAPTDQVCSDCVYSNKTSNAVLSWVCSTNEPLRQGPLDTGMRTYPDCRRIAVNDATWAGYWAPDPAYQTMAYAVCCR
jgi:hypothetical protein